MKITRRYIPFSISIIFFLLLFWGSNSYISYRKQNIKKDIRSYALEIIVGKKSKLEQALYSRIYYTRGVAAVVSVNPEIKEYEYMHLAKQFIANDSVISTMALSRDCTIDYIYPIKGHEKAIGLNLLDHPERKEIVENTIRTHKTFIAGPVELIEGGIAFISYTPIFDLTTQQENKFWGLTDIVIYESKLLNEAKLFEAENEFLFALKGENGKGMDGNVFWGDSTVFTNDPVTIDIELPTGKWVLAITPKNGWNQFYSDDDFLKVVLILSAFIISILLFLLIGSHLKIRNNQIELKAIFNSLEGIIIEYDKNGNYIKIAPTRNNLLIKSSEELIGKNVFDVLNEELATGILKAINECLSSSKEVILDYPLVINEEEKWFSAHITFKTKNSVIFASNDITLIKQREKDLRISENTLKETNRLKDRLFSILAHDLKNPVSSFKSITELILNKESNLSEAEKDKLIKGIYDSSTELSGLIENIFEWTLTQQKIGQINLQENFIYQTCEEVISSQQLHAFAKTISIYNLIEEGIQAKYDLNKTKTVLRNLISNAIKFSYPNNKVEITSEEKNNRVYIHIKDSGIGIRAQNLNSIFEWNLNASTIGTADEKGSGLGLNVCKEFIELQGGEIFVKNNAPSNGCTFTFTLEKA